MSRKRAKLMTATGFVSCAISFLLLVFGSNSMSSLLQMLLPLLFVGGIVLIFLSLAYYTEK